VKLAAPLVDVLWTARAYVTERNELVLGNSVGYDLKSNDLKSRFNIIFSNF